MADLEVEVSEADLAVLEAEARRQGLDLNDFLLGVLARVAQEGFGPVKPNRYP